MYTLDDVRRRPGLWFGSTGPRGIEFLILEVVSNSLDQVIGGRADFISVDLHDDGRITVCDNGPGFPLGHDNTGLSFLERVLTVPRDTPTADGHAPHVHLAGGVGLAPVNAVCAELEVLSSNGRESVRQRFCRGAAAGTAERMSSPDLSRGTSLIFHPDPELFGDSECDRTRLQSILRDIAHITPGLTIRSDTETYGPVEDLTRLFGRAVGRRGRLVQRAPFLISRTTGHLSVELALGWIEGTPSPTTLTFCNFKRTSNNGAEQLGIEEGLRLVLGQAPMRDVLRGLVCAMHVTLLDPTFGDPTRTRLDTDEAIWLIADAIADQLPGHLAANPHLAAELQSRVITRPAS